MKKNKKRFIPKENSLLKQNIIKAKQDLVPDNYIDRVIQFAKQGYKSIEFPTYNTDWDSEAYLTVSGQNSNNSIRVKPDSLLTNFFISSLRIIYCNAHFCLQKASSFRSLHVL